MRKCALVTVILIMSAFPLYAGVLDFFSHKTYSGKYRIGFETSAFYPQGMNEKWWAEGNVDQFGNDATLEKCFKDVVFKGVVSGKGQHGHLGQYDRLLTVDKTVKYTEIGCKDFEKAK